MIKREDIEYRIGQVYYNDKEKTSIKGVSFLVYINARTAFSELDEKFEGKWSFDWDIVPGETAVKGKLTIGDKTWCDVGYPNASKIDKEGEGKGEWLKDAVSDSVKRCAVQVGIGRELYDAPFLYAKPEELNIMKDGTVSRYEPLNSTGKQIIEGNIDKWFSKLPKE